MFQGRQEDAEEFLLQVFNVLHDEMVSCLSLLDKDRSGTYLFWIQDPTSWTFDFIGVLYISILQIHPVVKEASTESRKTRTTANGIKSDLVAKRLSPDR